MKRQLDYICLQPTQEGQASFAHVYEIVSGLRRRGWEVRLIQPRHPRPGRLDWLRRLFAASTTQLAYWWACRFRPAPFVYVRSHFLAFPTALIARAAGSIVVQEVNGAPGDAYDAWPRLRPFHRLLSWAGRTQLRWADAVIAVTPGLASFVAGYATPRGGFHVVGNGADIARFKPLGEDDPGAGTPYAAFVGALASWQGIDTALAAVASPVWPPDVDLVIVGDGRERERVERASVADPRVRWLGTVGYEESAAVISRCLASLVPKARGSSARYGLSPLKLYEGMASGVPVVVSDLEGLTDVVTTHDCGIVIPPGDAEALARAVARLAADPAAARAMGMRGRKAAEALYSWDARAGQTEKVLEHAWGVRVAARSKRGVRADTVADSPPEE